MRLLEGSAQYCSNELCCNFFCNRNEGACFYTAKDNSNLSFDSVLVLSWENCLVLSILCLKQILDCLLAAYGLKDKL